MIKKKKIERDRRAVRMYEEQLRARRKEYAQYADAYSMTGRRYRAEAVGECVLKLMDSLRDLNRKKRLLDGSLFWTITEQKVRDTDKKKGFHYQVVYHVKSDEDYYTEEEIRKEVEETYKKMLEETEEMYAREAQTDE